MRAIVDSLGNLPAVVAWTSINLGLPSCAQILRSLSAHINCQLFTQARRCLRYGIVGAFYAIYVEDARSSIFSQAKQLREAKQFLLMPKFAECNFIVFILLRLLNEYYNACILFLYLKNLIPSFTFTHNDFKTRILIHALFTAISKYNIF